jgi:hypothetical protein
MSRVAPRYWAAEHRAHELLRSWLSPEQREQYDACGCFEVVGSDSGRRYRIYPGHAFNIEELDAQGGEARAWCFTAEGVATGDVNLAQKIALETFERKALAIANGRSSGSTWRRAERLADGHRLQLISRAAALATAYCLIVAIILIAVISGINSLVPA